MLTKERIAERKEWLGVAEAYLPHFAAAKNGTKYIDDVHREAIDDLLSLLSAEERRLAETEARLKEPTDEERKELLTIFNGLTYYRDCVAPANGTEHTRALEGRIRALILAPKEEKPKVTMTDLLVALKSKGIGRLVYVSGDEGYWKIPHSNVPRLGELFGVAVVEEKER
jgi:hypothetical protein